MTGVELCAGEKCVVILDEFGRQGNNKKSQVCDRAPLPRPLPCLHAGQASVASWSLLLQEHASGAWEAGPVGIITTGGPHVTESIKVSSSARRELLRVGIIRLGTALAANPPGQPCVAGWRMDG